MRAEIALIIENEPTEDGHAELRVRDKARPDEPPLAAIKMDKPMCDSEFIEFCRSLSEILRTKVTDLDFRLKNPTVAAIADRLFNRG